MIWRGENILEKFKDLSLKPSTGRTDMDGKLVIVRSCKYL